MIEPTKTAMHCNVFSHHRLNDSFNELIDRILDHNEKNEDTSFESGTEGEDDLLKVMEPTPIGPRIHIVDSSKPHSPPLSKTVGDSYYDTRHSSCVHQLCNGYIGEQTPPVAPTSLPRDLFRISTDFDDQSFRSTSLSSSPAVVPPSPNASKMNNPKDFRAHQADHWDNQYKTMKKYREANGHCFVPQHYPENPSLAMWIKRQRYQYKLKENGEHSTLTNERQSKLDAIGFIWDSHKGKWEERYATLLKYRKVYGHPNLPNRFHDKQLAAWFKCQRRMYKLYMQGEPSSMTMERIAKLEEIGFDWTPRLGRRRKRKSRTDESP